MGGLTILLVLFGSVVIGEGGAVLFVQLDPEGNVLVEMAWPENNWLYGFILSFGAAVLKSTN